MTLGKVLADLLSKSNSGALQHMGDALDDMKRMFDRSVACGESYSTSVGDVTFFFNFQNYSPSSVTVSVDGVRVMLFKADGGLTRELKSTSLDNHVRDAANVILKQVAEKEQQRIRRDIEERRDANAKKRSVADRFGASIV